MKNVDILLKQAFFVSLVLLFVAQILESIFPGFVTQTVTFDSLLFLAMLVGVSEGYAVWHVTHFQPKSQIKL